MTLYLEQYLDNLQMLPGELQRNLRLLRELDQKAQNHLDQGDRLTAAYAAGVTSYSPADRKKRYEEIQSHYTKAKSFGDEKVQLAMQTYEMVDKHIRRLDADLARFESELKRNILTAKNDELATDADKKKKAIADSGTDKKKRKEVEDSGKTSKKKKTDESSSNDGVAATAANDLKQHLASLTGVGLMQQLTGMGADVLDMPIDPNEPVYCVCRQVSYGEMIGCDNADCPIEWFHFNCVGLSSKPKGKWFCPRCTDEKKKQKN